MSPKRRSARKRQPHSVAPVQHPERSARGCVPVEESPQALWTLPLRKRAKRILTEEQKRARRRAIEARREARVAEHEERRAVRQAEARRRDEKLKSRPKKPVQSVPAVVARVPAGHVHRRRRVPFHMWKRRMQRYVDTRVNRLKKRLSRSIAVAAVKAGISIP